MIAKNKKNTHGFIPFKSLKLHIYLEDFSVSNTLIAVKLNIVANYLTFTKIHL